MARQPGRYDSEIGPVNVPDWRDLGLAEGVLAEAPGQRRGVFWIPMGSEGRYRLWERVGPAPGAEVVGEEGVLLLAATASGARQRIEGRVGGLLRRLVSPAGDRIWYLPDGRVVERFGGRRTDLAFVWAGEGAGQLDVAQVRARWPGCREVRAIAEGLFLVAGVEVKAGEISPRVAAERAVEVARRRGDWQVEASALIDLGFAVMQEGDVPRAVEILEAASSLARELVDEAREADAGLYLGSALVLAGQVDRGLGLLEASRAAAGGDRFAEKLALEKLGLARGVAGDPAGALEAFERAAVAAGEAGDLRHEATLRWQAAIRLDELGQRDGAFAAGQRSVEVLEGLGDPAAVWYADHLHRYRAGDGPMSSVDISRSDAGEAPGRLSGGVSQGGPGMLRMALSAGKAMAAFLGSGMETTVPEIRRERLRACSDCEHHTGLRCQLCGCFTGAKARLPHETCPIGRWREPGMHRREF